MQEEAVHGIRHHLESVLQLLSRVSCLGPIEAFFTGDDLLQHYQRHVDAAAALSKKLHQQRQQVRAGAGCSMRPAAGNGNHFVLTDPQ